MVKPALMVMLGILLGVLGCVAGWMLSAECPPNVLVIMGSLPKEQSAHVFVQDKLIWSGSTWAGAKINFDMAPGEGQFLVRVGDGEFTRGYVERADGRDHILSIGKEDVSYTDIYRGVFEHGRRVLACR